MYGEFCDIYSPNAERQRVEENKNKSKFVITVKGEDLDCVKKALIVINNCIYEEGNIISEYNVKLLNALLGENWTERYEFGKRFMNDN